MSIHRLTMYLQLLKIDYFKYYDDNQLVYRIKRFMKTSFIEYHQFDSTKIRDVGESKLPNNFQFYTPMYSYTQKSKYPLLIKTDFIDLSVDPFKFLSVDSKKFILIDANDKSVSHLYKSLHDIAKFTNDYIEKINTGKAMLEIGPILSNYGPEMTFINKTKSLNTDLKMSGLKLYFNERNNKIVSTIYNYNKSKKYKSIEEFNSCDLSDIARFITKGKQVRFILEPKMWQNNGTFGTKLYIKYMEVKYKDQIIKSKLDEIQTETHETITSVEI